MCIFVGYPNGKKWWRQMQSEIDSLEYNNTWILTTISPHPRKKVLSCKQVYKIKRKTNGSIERDKVRYKAHLVILGNTQVEGLDYHKTFVLVAKMVTIRTLLSVATAKNCKVHQTMHFSTGHKGKVCRLQKSLYGLKQASRCWFSPLASVQKDSGFRQTYSDYSLFTYSHSDNFLCMLVYVDDLIIIGTHLKAIQKFKNHLYTCFHMKDLEHLKYFLGIEIAMNIQSMYLCERKYPQTLSQMQE